MAKKVREQTVSLSSYLASVNSEDISENQDVQRMFCWDNPAMNELIVTVLTEDYIPPIILGEEELGGDLTQQYIVDGIQRTTALNKFRHMNWKTTKSFENGIIQYQAKMRDNEGHLIKGEDGSVLWENREFDIKNKTFEQLPDELKKKFDDYQIRIVIHQNCTMQEISKLVRRYNRNKSMGSNQKALTWIPTYARKIKNIANNEFYKNCVAYSKSMRKNGTYEQTVANSVMATFHLDNWKKTPNDRNEYLEEHSSFDEFEQINEYGNRIAKVCSDKFKNIFVFKDILCWIATFHNFTKLELPDSKFSEFISYLVTEGHSKFIGENSYDSLNKETGTTDKKVVQDKIDTYTTLMNEYLHNDNIEKETENSVVVKSKKDDVLDFINATAHVNVNGDDVMEYMDYIDNIVRVSSPVYHQCYNALLALTAYVYKNDQDQEFADFMADYADNTYDFGDNQAANYNQMKSQFTQYLKRMKVNA